MKPMGSTFISSRQAGASDSRVLWPVRPRGGQSSTMREDVGIWGGVSLVEQVRLGPLLGSPKKLSAHRRVTHCGQAADLSKGPE